MLTGPSSDLDLKGTLRDPAVALEHALLYLHENRVVELDKGRSVFRSAMTIQTDPEALKRRFAKDDFLRNTPLRMATRMRGSAERGGVVTKT